MFYNNRNPEEENQGGVTLATSPGTASPMQPANFQVGPLADHTQQPSAAQQAATNIGSNVAGKVVDGALFGGETGAALGMGETGLISKGMSGLTGMFGAGGAGAGTAAAGGGMLGGAIPAASGLGGAAAGSLGAGAASAGLAAAAPVAIPALFAAKAFGWLNKGGSVGPLSAQYHADGDEIEVPKSKPRYLMYPYQSNIETPMARPRPMTYGEAYDKAYGKYGFDHMEPESEWGKSLYHGFNKALSPSIALDAKIMQWMHNKEMRDAGVPGFNQGGNVEHKEHGGMTGPLSNNKSVKMEKKETIEYKN